MSRLHQLIEDKTVDINQCYRRMKSNAPLVLLCQRHRSHSLCQLIEAFVKRDDLIIDECSPNGFNALMFICRFYRSENLIDCVQLLVNRGINLEAREKDGRTALDFLCLNYKSNNLVDILLLLIHPNNVDQCMNILRQREFRSKFVVMERILRYISPGCRPVSATFYVILYF